MEITIEELRFEMPLETEARHGIVLQLDQLASERIGGRRDDDVRRAFAPKLGQAGQNDPAAHRHCLERGARDCLAITQDQREQRGRSEEHTSELQSLLRISYAVFCF